LTDYFIDSNYKVELEKELSVQEQFLDVIIIRQESGKPIEEVPDGLENLGEHNVLTYKSLHQPVDSWTIDELVGHYVNYRKLVSPTADKLLPIEQFRLYAVSTRYPQKLETEASLHLVKAGVYEVQWGSHAIRVIVLSRVPEAPRNAVWQLFSAIPEKVLYGAAHYRWRQSEDRKLIRDLHQKYQVEGITMPYTLEDYHRDSTMEYLRSLSPEELLKALPIKELLKALPPEERLKGLPPEERLKGLPPEERLKGLPPKERLKGLPPKERLKGLPPKERLKGLPPKERLKGLPVKERLRGLKAKEIEAYLKTLRKREQKKSSMKT
jgi:hypothetical protein